VDSKTKSGKFVTKTVVAPAQRVKMLDPETGAVAESTGVLGKLVTKTVVAPAKRVKMLESQAIQMSTHDGEDILQESPQRLADAE
jgi:membrane protein YdbS with pleckstrin-like domain